MPIVKQTAKDPLTDNESAIAALTGHITKENKITRGGMYLLELINQNIRNGKNIYQRIPQSLFGGLSEGGRKNVSASALCRAERASNAGEQEEILPSGYTRIQEVIGQWAERDGCWHDTPEADLISEGRTHRAEFDGSEARIFYDNKARVYKTLIKTHYDTYQELLDRITIHNRVFPETAIRVEGFGMLDDADDNEGFTVVISQPFVKGETPRIDQIQEAMRERGFVPIGNKYVSEDGYMTLNDIHDNNCVISEEGNLLVFDCEAFLNQTKPGHDKPLNHNPESVQKINQAIKEILPDVKPKQDILDLLPREARETARDSLEATGRLEGPVISHDGTPLIVQSDPENSDKVLVSTPDKIRRMMRLARPDEGRDLTREERNTLISGRSVTRDGKRLAFNLDKGRIDTFRGPIMKLKMTHKTNLTL